MSEMKLVPENVPATEAAEDAAVVSPLEKRENEARQALGFLGAELQKAVLERTELIPVVFDALIAKEHVFVLGEPGTGKSYLLELIAMAFDVSAEDGTYFETLVSKHSEPTEFFGPISIKGIKEDNFTRVTTGMMPEAKLAFLDEVFKGNSAVLNGLLKILNERKFRNGSKVVKCPLWSVVAAANEVPDLAPKQGDSLAAMYDRFLIRALAERLDGDDNFDAMTEDELPSVTAKVTFADLEVLADVAKTVTFSDDTRMAIRAIRTALEDAGVKVSDRRWKAIKRLMRCRCARLGRTRVTQEMLPLINWCAWSKPEQAATVEQIVQSNMAEWRQETTSSESELDEKLTLIANATTGVELASVTDDIVQMQKDLRELAAENPEAQADVDDLLVKAGKVSAANLAKLTALASAGSVS